MLSCLPAMAGTNDMVNRGKSVLAEGKAPQGISLLFQRAEPLMVRLGRDVTLRGKMWALGGIGRDTKFRSQVVLSLRVAR